MFKAFLVSCLLSSSAYALSNDAPVPTNSGADSTKLSSPATSAVPIAPAPQYSTPNPVVASGNYSSLPACPTTPVCPDINGNAPAGQTLNCPASCTVTRAVTYSGSTITGFTPAVCPVNYGVVTMYNMQPEIIYYAQAQVYSPITQTQYNALSSYPNFSCSAGNEINLGTICDQAGGGSITSVLGFPGGNSSCSGPFSLQACTTSKSGGCPGGAGTMAYYWVCRTGCATTGSVQWTGSCGGIGGACTAKATYAVYVKPASCSLPAGYYQTSNTQAVSLVCAPFKMVWTNQTP